MNISDKLLEELGLKYEDLEPAERDTYNQGVFNVKTISIADLRDHIVDMKNAIAIQLSSLLDTTEETEKDLWLKAKLQVYLQLEAFLTAPDKAEKALRDQLKNIKPQKGK